MNQDTDPENIGIRTASGTEAMLEMPDLPIVPDADEGSSFFGNPLVRSLLSASAAIILLSFAATYLFVMRGADGTIVLHFNVYFGVDIVGSPWQALLIPGMSLLFLLLNVPLAYRFYAVRERVAAHILLFASFFAALLSGVATAALSLINS